MSGVCQIHQENVKLTEINLVSERGGITTSFKNTFIEINKLAKKYYKHNNIGIIFMSDGECDDDLEE